jgi:hypothetical protein
VNLLLTGSEQSERPIYVTITMRSDYLGDCSEIPGLAEAVKPYFRTMAVLLLCDQGETERAREVLDGIGNWIQQQREQDWRTWAIQLAVYREASRKLRGP